MEKYKTEILNVQTFLENRPNLYVHSEQEISSAIYQSASVLNGETAGLVQKVWDYMSSGNVDSNNEFYRTTLELSFLKEAFIVQTQFTLNNANSFVQGSNSFNATGFNISSSTPVERDILAPNVRTLLQQANMYVFQAISSSKSSNVNNCAISDTENYLTQNQMDQRYVRTNPPYARPNQIPIISNENTQNQVVWTDPQNIFDLNGINIRANEVLDKDNQYRELKQTLVVNELGTYAQNVADTLGNELRSQFNKIADIQERLESGIIFKYRGDWEPERTYKILDIVRYTNGKLYWVKVPSTNTEPTRSEDWADLTPNTVDLSAYATIEWVNQQLTNKLTQDQANNQYVSLTKNQTITGNKILNADNFKFKMVGNTGWVEVTKKDGSRLGFFGKAASASDKFYMWAESDNIFLRAPNGKNIEIDQVNNVISAKSPTHNAHLTNKQYVDNADTALRNALNDLRDSVSTIRNYDPNTTYKLGDQVFLEANQEFYISTQNNNIGHDPETSPDYWKWLTNNAGGGGGGDVDLTSYLKKSEAERIYAKLAALEQYYTITQSEELFAKKGELVGLATEQWVQDQNYATQAMLSNYVTTSFLNNNYDTANVANEKYLKLNLPDNQSQRVAAKTFFDKQVTIKFPGTNWLEFLASDNTRYALMGKTTSTNNTFQIWAEKDNLLLKAPNNKNVEIGGANNVHSEKAPSNQFHLTNKKYVDAQVTTLRNEVNPKFTDLTNKITANTNNIATHTQKIARLEEINGDWVTIRLNLVEMMMGVVYNNNFYSISYAIPISNIDTTSLYMYYVEIEGLEPYEWENPRWPLNLETIQFSGITSIYTKYIDPMGTAPNLSNPICFASQQFDPSLNRNTKDIQEKNIPRDFYFPGEYIFAKLQYMTNEDFVLSINVANWTQDKKYKANHIILKYKKV